ncbi:MAG: hypothetical protein LBE04_02705 [Prevotellaceae bacterium]|jgi:hypothetical protein|nr:hypothetical protein [Prevotellaceae bacterium]
MVRFLGIAKNGCSGKGDLREEKGKVFSVLSSIAERFERFEKHQLEREREREREK